ncbi:hypothetical protein CORT_0B00890 [Candida orthopsilosis Co 90-125]|uniref:Rrn9 domain-containing protein n=1 Tax=Candida orthopsilosis (strain 90-125) TaxID=1136231 RepID=H8WZE1_CANO9|nr:hypothetical protein CORT_0B00890 [Candida orthopsilosis Co 90-125]CCG21809.1 hypothetical protein CORT_0B00890 [Candida orthopsilosis Co 90-125]
MSIQQERTRILQSLEHEFINDLSLHLYSSFLLHRINPNFPLPRWTHWPKHFDKVPVPNQKYEDDLIDNCVERFEWDIDDDRLMSDRDRVWYKEGGNEKRKEKRKKELSVKEGGDKEQEKRESQRQWHSQLEEEGISDSSSRSSDNDSLVSGSNDDGNDSDNSDDLDYNEEELLDPNNKIIEVTYTESIPSAKISLMNSISSLLESKIRNKIQKLKNDGKIDTSLIMTSDSLPRNLLLPIVGGIANRFNSMLDTMFDTFHLKDYPLNWRQILLAGMINDRLHNKLNPQMYEKLIHKCEGQFEHVHNVYEFDDDEAREEAVEEDVVTDDGGFNVEKYLESLQDEYAGPGQKDYSVLAQEYLRDFNGQVNFSARLKQNMINMIHGEEDVMNRKKRRRSSEDEDEEDEPTDESDKESNWNDSNLALLHQKLLQQRKELQDSYTIKL